MQALFRSLSLYLLFSLVSVAARANEVDRPWMYTTPAALDPPPVKDEDRIRNEVDAFILAKLEEAGLQPAQEASRHTLIRRLYLDLIGLPPTPAEVDTFVSDTSADAYEKLVDRLLLDSRYGERWGRLWLDLARYADTAGYEGDPDLPHAWRYRDYVIDAFNNDKPYDEFIKDQIAGDEYDEVMGAADLPATDPEQVVALTFLRLAPFTEPRGDETRHEMLSEITSTVGSVFLGLTVGCAKCHDHKYDHIPTKDFYRLKAFFATVSMPRPEPGDGFQIGGSLDAKFYRPSEEEWSQRRRDALQQEMDSAKAELAEFQQRANEHCGFVAGFGVQFRGQSGANNYVYDTQNINDRNLHFAILNADGQRWQIYTDGAGSGNLGALAGSNQGDWFADLTNAQFVSLGKHTVGRGTPFSAPHRGRFAEILIYDHSLDDQQRAAVSQYIRSKYFSVTVAGAESPAPDEPPADGLKFWLDASDLDAASDTANPEFGVHVDSWTDKVAQIRLRQENIDLQPKLEPWGGAQAATVSFDDDFLVGPAKAASFLGDERGSLVAVFSTTQAKEGYGLEVGGDGEFLATVVSPGATNKRLMDFINDPELVTDEERERFRYVSDRERFVKQHLKRLQPLAMSLRHSYGPPYEPGVAVSWVMIRGEYDNPGEMVEPGFLSCITGNQDPAPIRLDPFKRWPTRSRRMALAQWIADGDNPLTARVMANRLWHWHFGTGIVATPSDFGQLSGGPSHPHLLDWLAVRFVNEKWSIKAMHRLMVTSSTYRQASTEAVRADAANPHVVDPDNRLLWKFPRRRLEAEAVRDTVLAVSGRLNPEQFGLPIFPPLPGDVAERVKYSQSKWDTQTGPEGRKRSIYIYQQRTLTMPLMQVFDSLVCDESRPRRRSSVTPLQALAMYNGEFVNEEAKHFAARVRTEAGEQLDSQVDRAFLLAFSRRPTSDEVARMGELVRQSEPAGQGLLALCRVLLNANEFMYVD